MARKGEIIDRTGEHFVNNQGCSFFIVKYNNNEDCRKLKSYKSCCGYTWEFVGDNNE